MRGARLPVANGATFRKAALPGSSALSRNEGSFNSYIPKTEACDFALASIRHCPYFWYEDSRVEFEI
jgi:hypothetical protein